MNQLPVHPDKLRFHTGGVMLQASPSVVSRAASRPYQLYRANAQCFETTDRLDAWAAVAFDTLEFLGAEQSADSFQAELAWARANGGEFCSYTGSSYVARGRARTAQQASIVVVYLQRGLLEIRGPGGLCHVVPEGTLVAFRSLADLRFHWTNVQEVHVVLPPVRLKRADTALDDQPVVYLDATVVAPFLRNHLALLALRADRLDCAELAGVLDPVLELARVALYSSGRQASLKRAGLGLYEAALDLIESHCHKPEFGVAALIRALGCSRAKLYRAFASQGCSVTSALRNIRLQRARQLIEAGSPDTSIGSLAYACGFVDQSAFGKMFRRQFGVSPGKWRRSVAAGVSPGSNVHVRQPFIR